MTRRKSSTLRVVFAALLLIASAASGTAIARALSTQTAPTVTALLSPPDGAVLSASSRPTFAFQATPGGRFRVQFSSGNAPFFPVLDSGRRTTSGDCYKPNVSDWRSIVALGAGGRPVYWRVVALGMTADQIAATPVASFTIAP
jgi:hypothetical protein